MMQKIRKPCTKPFDATEIGNKSLTVKLAFNYWMENAQIRDDDISKIIMNLYFPTFDSKIFTIPPEATDKINHVVVVAAHCINYIDLQEQFQNLRFLPLCSSVPVNHSPQSGLLYRYEYLRFRYYTYSS